MKTTDFDYYLPKDLIAQVPLRDRDSSRLLVLNKRTGGLSHKVFTDVIEYLNPGDCLVLNDTKVIPARIFGHLEKSDSLVEFLLLKDMGQNTWETLVKPGKKAKIEAKLEFKKDVIYGKILDILPSGSRVIKFYFKGNFYNILEEIGAMPVPHYIKKNLEEKDRYQTVYAKEIGSCAAPTAGLHFTESLLSKIEENGINIAKVTLHVGLGTFRPVKCEDIKDHKMHTEWYSVPKESAKIINDTKKIGKKVFCVGTTSCRTLESVFAKYGQIVECCGETDIFIYPGFKFKVMDALITNFHLPKSTLIMLVCAFAGKENVLNAYKTAVEQKYRFFSFGDAMLVL